MVAPKEASFRASCCCRDAERKPQGFLWHWCCHPKLPAGLVAIAVVAVEKRRLRLEGCGTRKTKQNPLRLLLLVAAERMPPLDCWSLSKTRDESSWILQRDTDVRDKMLGKSCLCFRGRAKNLEWFLKNEWNEFQEFQFCEPESAATTRKNTQHDDAQRQRRTRKP